MTKIFVTTLGKGIRRIAQLRGGSGSALPGLFVEKIDPNFIADTLKTLPRGAVVISGTNGKTTTTKMVVELLEGQGLKVFTNRTGSNFTRGVAAALLGEVNTRGQLDADIAVLELDEAHAVHFVRAVKPRYSLLLNVMRDQLDRFGEIDTTAGMLATIAASTTDTVVLNRDDPRIGVESFSAPITAVVKTFGASDEVRHQFPSDDDLRTAGTAPRATGERRDDTELVSFAGQSAKISFADSTHDVTLKLNGVYNVLNSVGAAALVRAIMGDNLDASRLISSLANVTPAFGRGESLIVNGQPFELILVKNPAGFRLALQSFSPEHYRTMIAINDNYADGRDMSWLWDVDFDSLRPGGVSVVTGVRATDMALRLKYEEVPVEKVIDELPRALKYFTETDPSSPKRVYCTYTAMLELRRLLGKYTDVERVR